MHALPAYPKRAHLARCGALLLALAVLSACGEASSSGETADPRAPTEEAYRRAVETALETYNPACVHPKALDPVISDGFPVELDVTRRVNQELIRELDALRDAGLVQVAEETGSSMRRYELTRQGDGLLREVPAPDRKTQAFCFATPEVVDISTVEERGDLQQDGSQVEVHFTYRLRDVADWAAGEAFQRAFPQAAEMLEAQGAPQEAHTVLVLTTDGWVDERLH